MGLDMYLTKKTYIGNKWAKEGGQELVGLKQHYKTREIKEKRISSISEEVMYWRKSNYIHKWFVDNCGGGNDNCQEYYVSEEQLKELLTLCKEVLANKASAKDILPTQSGFFFGGTDCDDYYFEDIEQTANELTKLLEEKGSGDFYYQASW